MVVQQWGVDVLILKEKIMGIKKLRDELRSDAKKKTDLATIKKSTIYGNVMGSFAVQGYGLEGLLRIKKMDIKKGSLALDAIN